MNVNDLSKIKERFDTIFCVRALKFWDDPEKTFADAHKLLNKDGRILVHFIHRNLFTSLLFSLINRFRWLKQRTLPSFTIGTGTEKQYTNTDVIDMLKKAGFKITKQYYYFNPLFAFLNFAKHNSILTSILIFSDRHFRWGWRSVVVGVKRGRS